MRARRGGAAGAPDPHKLCAARPLRHAPGGLVVYLDLFTPYLLRHDHGVLDDVLADPYLFLGHRALLHRLLSQRNHHFLPPISAPEATSPSTSTRSTRASSRREPPCAGRREGVQGRYAPASQ